MYFSCMVIKLPLLYETENTISEKCQYFINTFTNSCLNSRSHATGNNTGNDRHPHLSQLAKSKISYNLYLHRIPSSTIANQDITSNNRNGTFLEFTVSNIIGYEKLFTKPLSKIISRKVLLIKLRPSRLLDVTSGDKIPRVIT